MRKTYTNNFRTRAVLEIFKEEKTISEIASEYEVHPNQLGKWRKQAINGLG
jgi:putative transposase